MSIKTPVVNSFFSKWVWIFCFINRSALFGRGVHAKNQTEGHRKCCAVLGSG